MSNFRHKQFNGKLYTFEHLAPIRVKVPLNASATSEVDLHITFGCHCFTEAFSSAKHQDQHRYIHKGELRAFDLLRHECSMQLPSVLERMLRGTIYRAGDSYTYSAQIELEFAAGTQSYSVFFSLEKDRTVQVPALRMFVKSAYLKPLVAKPNAQSWRFPSLAGQVSGAFPPQEKKTRPKKKGTP
ncbi:hypothetical protein [Pseudoduganella sp. OTU4001]|uniref:hypothetical protein n=1 Tax=Pseudoduganella sp. OTU4001 TaxID=3043854 RepID=UPI00313D6868